MTSVLTHSPYPQIPLDDALAIVAADVAPLPSERVLFTDAVGRFLAAPVQAIEAMPPFAASARDGYAVVAADGAGERRIVGEAVAGSPGALHVQPGTVARITTGAPLPDGADAVVMIEDSQAPVGDTVRIDRAVHSGENVRPIAQDYAAGEMLLPAGVQIDAASLGLLASVGAVEVEVFRRPRVVALSTGDELVEPGAPLSPGKIRDSNRFALAAAAREAGAEVVRVASIRDTQEQLTQLREAAEIADVVLTSGGVSMGHRDLVKPWLAAHGEIHFGRVRVKPGKPVTYARVGQARFFGLPGFPVSTLVAFELFARPALRAMLGDPRPRRATAAVRLAHDLEHAQDRDELARAVVWQAPDGSLAARTTGFQGSGRLLSMTGANALLRLPAGDGHSPTGTVVQAHLLGPLAPAPRGAS